MATNPVSIFDAMGVQEPQEPSWSEKALGAVGLGKAEKPVVHEGVVSIFAAQGIEEPEPTTMENIGGFLHDPESWKQMGSRAAVVPKVGIAAADLLLGVPGQAAGVAADLGARLYSLAKGESRKASEIAGQEAMATIPEALTMPLQNLAKKLFGAEPHSQETITRTIDASADIVDQYTKGIISAADAKSALNIVMLSGGIQGIKVGAKELARPKKEAVKTAVTEEAPVAEPEVTPAPSLYERIAPEAKAPTPEEAIAASKQRIKEIKAAVKAETPAEKAARVAMTRLPETEAVWTSGKEEIPVRVTGEPVKGPDGKMYTPVKQQGTATMVPTAELKAAPSAEPQVGLPEPKAAETPLAVAVDKVKEGRGYSLKDEEVSALNSVARAGAKIVDVESKPIGPALKQTGEVDPRLLAALGIGSGAVALALQPEGIEKLSNLGLIGLGTVAMTRGEGSPLSIFKEAAHPYRLNAIEALPEGKIQFSKQEVLDRATKWPTEKKVLERVLGAVEGDKVSAKALMEGVLAETSGWKLTPKETTKYADYGLNKIGRTPEKATTTQWELPEHMQMSDANHFQNKRLFGWTRSFKEDGIQHVVEVQSDLAQHAKGAVPEAERPALMQRIEEILAKRTEMRKRQGEDVVRSGEYMRLKLEMRELENKLNATAIDTQLSPIIKNWPRQLIRHTLQDAAKRGEERVRFASADTVAKVEMWPMEEGKLLPEHQGIYNRYAGEVTRYLKGLGGVEVRDAQGHTWWEVPTKSVLDTRGRIEQVGAARTELLAGIAAAGGAAAYLAANPDDAGKLAVLGLLGTMAAKGRSLKGIVESDLVQRVRGGDAAAFAELYQRTSPTVKNSLRSYERAGIDTEDIVQRTYEKVYKALEKDPEAPGGFRGDSSVETFAYRTAHNLAKNAVRDAKTKPQTVSLETELAEGQTLEDTLGHGETPLKAMETQALQQKLSEAMGKVDPDFRRAFEMRELEGMSYEDIATELNVPVGTVRSRIFRAKEQLQHAMRDYRGKEAGKADIPLMAGVAAVAGGTVLGAYIDKESPIHGALYGAGLGALATRISPRRIAETIASASARAPLIKIDDLSRATVWARKQAKREAYKLSYDVETRVPEVARREAIFRHLDGDTSVKLTPAELGVAKDVKAFYDTLGGKAKESGVIKELLQDYATRIYGKDISGFLRERIVGNPTGLDSPFGKRRAYPTLAEAEAAGHVPVTTDIAKVIEAYSDSVTNAMENRNFIQTLKSTKTPEGLQLIEKEGKAPADYARIDHSQLRGYAVHPDIAGDLRFIFDSVKPGAIVKTLDAINTTQKRMAVSFSLFHAAALEHAMLGATSILKSPERALRVAGQSFAPAIFGENLAVRAIREGGAGDFVDAAMRDGLEFGFERQSPALMELRSGFYEAVDSTTKFLDNTVPGLGKYTTGAFAAVNHMFDRAMWGRFHAAMKLETYADKASELSRNNAREVESGRGVLKSKEEIGRAAASFTNDVFGGLNWQGIVQEMGHRWSREVASAALSPVGRFGMRMVLFAPDWTISTTRAFVKAFGPRATMMGAGAVLGSQVSPQDKFTGGALGALAGLGAAKVTGLHGTTGSGFKGLIRPTELTDLHRQYVMRSAFIYSAIVDALNVQMSGHHLWENKDPTRLDRGDGTTQQVSKHFMEPIHWLLTPRQQALNKLSFVVKEPLAQIMDTEYLSTTGAPRMGKTPKGQDIALGTRIGHVAKAFDPISMQQSVEGSTGRGIAGFLGAPIYGKTKAEQAAAKAELKRLHNSPEYKALKAARKKEKAKYGTR